MIEALTIAACFTAPAALWVAGRVYFGEGC